MTNHNLKPIEYGENATRDEARNAEILRASLEAFDKITGPRVGDYLRMPNGKLTRFTHAWGESIQTGGTPGNSYYLNGPWISYSGGLDPGIKYKWIEPTFETEPGNIWFFSFKHSGAFRDVHYKIDFRVFRVKPGTPAEELTGLCMKEATNV